jgi:RNA polymerase sigma factor (sigma-70 family)
MSREHSGPVTAVANLRDDADRPPTETPAENMVHAVARAYRGARVPFADLVQEGTIALVRTVERFDHRRGVKSSTHGVWRIRRSMLDAIAGSNLIRMPAKASKQLAAVRRAEAELDRLPVGVLERSTFAGSGCMSDPVELHVERGGACKVLSLI